MKKAIIVGGALAGFALVTVAPAAGADPVVPPSLQCDQIGECNIVQYTIENYLRLPSETAKNYRDLPGQTVQNYLNLIPDTIKNYTGIDIRQQPSTSTGTSGTTTTGSGTGGTTSTGGTP